MAFVDYVAGKKMNFNVKKKNHFISVQFFVVKGRRGRYKVQKTIQRSRLSHRGRTNSGKTKQVYLWRSALNALSIEITVIAAVSGFVVPVFQPYFQP